jgi:hypothetical protein
MVHNLDLQMVQQLFSHPPQVTYFHLFGLEFDCINNMADYEALLLGPDRCERWA